MTRAGARRGFTLLEILISVFVLVVGVLGVMKLLPALTRSGAAVERGQEISRRIPFIVEALQAGARSTRTRDFGGAQPAAFIVFSHPAALDAKAGDPNSPQILGSRACLLLPRGSDKALIYPRSGWPEEIRAKNGAGRVENAEGAATLSDEELLEVDTYMLQASPSAASIGFALRIQRALVDGAPVDGLYSVTILFFLESPGGPKRLLHTFTTEISAGPGSPAGDEVVLLGSNGAEAP